MLRIHGINEFANRCGYFFNACLDPEEDCTCNNGYNCRHPGVEETYLNPKTGHKVGMCYGWACPFGFEPDEEDFKSPNIDQNGYEEYEEGEFIIVDDEKLFATETMDAITLWQPWATLTVTGEKRIETRSWNTNFRGRVAMHAAKSDHSGILLHIPMGELEYFQKAGVCGMPEPPRGVIVGTIEIIDCRPIEQLYGSRYDTPKERAFGDWSKGRFGWILDAPMLFKTPIPASGKQGFWKWRPQQ